MRCGLGVMEPAGLAFTAINKIVVENWPATLLILYVLLFCLVHARKS